MLNSDKGYQGLRFARTREFQTGVLAGCEVCNNDTRASHEVTLEDGYKYSDDLKINVCPIHSDMARQQFGQFFLEWICAGHQPGKDTA